MHIHKSRQSRQRLPHSTIRAYTDTRQYHARLSWQRPSGRAKNGYLIYDTVSHGQGASAGAGGWASLRGWLNGRSFHHFMRRLTHQLRAP
eukprot:4353622-Pleurochrysis_carterae.AAC.1